MSASSSTTRIRPLLRSFLISSGGSLSGMRHFSDQRKLHLEARSRAELAFYFNGTAVLADDAISDGEAQSGPFAGGLGGEERVIDAGHAFGRYALSCVGDFDAGHGVFSRRSLRDD